MTKRTRAATYRQAAESADLLIRLVTAADAAALAAYHSRNAAHFLPWEPQREPGYYSALALERRLQTVVQMQAKGQFAVFIGLEQGQVVGHCTLSQIVYGAFRAACIGYAIDKAWEGTGTMRRICERSIDHAFSTLQLNRLMASHMPANTRSAGLLMRLGFEREGYARRYLKINGRWEDHVMTALLKPLDND